MARAPRAMVIAGVAWGLALGGAMPGVLFLMLVSAVYPGPAEAGWTVTDMAALCSSAAPPPCPDRARVLANTLAGAGITVTGATYVGADRAAGVFTAEAGAIGFGEGIILSTGDIRNVVDQSSGTLFDWGVGGPNSSTTLISTVNETPGDAALATLMSGATTHDAASLEIKFIPDQPFIQMQYVFSSDEYNEYVNTGFSDVFALYLNGTNVALLPDSMVAVAIDTVNAGGPYGAPPFNHPQYFIDNTDHHLDTEMDGLTFVMTVQAAANPGVVNTLRIAITDVLDDLGDSNVFLRSSSLTSMAELTDTDADGVPDFLDNCAELPNPTQADSNFNGVGDECDTVPPLPPVPITFEKITGGGAVAGAQAGAAAGTFGFNVDSAAGALRVHLEYNDSTESPAQNPAGVAQIKINAAVTDFTAADSLYGPGVAFTVPCVVRTHGTADGPDVNTCSVLLQDNGEPATGSIKQGTPADRFKLMVVSGPSAGYASGPPALVRGNIQAH